MRGEELVLEIGFHDRLGLGYEIFSLLKNRHINLLGMEAKASEKMTIKFKGVPKTDLDELLFHLKQIDGVHSIAIQDLMPYEHRERQLTTILNSVSEGIIAVNFEGNITHINEMAKVIFQLSHEKVIGVHAGQLLGAKIPIITTLRTGDPYYLKEIKLKKGNKSIHYLTSGVPILNDEGNVIGAVATIKDFKQVEQIVSKMDHIHKQSFHNIIHQSDQMRKVIETSKIVSKTSSSILLRGESGTGKELFAKAIHMESNRSSSPFVVINCAALPEALLESELFGYEEGSFTGAAKGGKKGLFEQANKGTLFLDEVGELSPHMQVRLLRVLQEGTIRKIGSHKEIQTDVRIIAATHRNLEEMVKHQSFREDLYYRLNVVPIRIPSLRERKEDIPLLVHHLIGKICLKLDRLEASISHGSITYLMNQQWPGNVRQLENTLERILNVISKSEITIDDIHQWAFLDPSIKSEKIEVDDRLCIPFNLEKGFLQLKHILDDVEKMVILEVVKNYDSSRKAGKVLGISNTAVLNKMKKYGLDFQQLH
jgi:TyrR family helix-turn-helix protein/PAS domain S-box-containing protein